MTVFDIELMRDRIVVSITGELSPEHAADLSAEMLVTAERAPTPKMVVIDFRKMTACGIFARSELIKMQRGLRDSNARTAYVADVARYRGLALWVINLAEDQGAKVCFHDDMADAWLASTAGRLEDTKTRTKTALRDQKGVAK